MDRILASQNPRAERETMSNEQTRVISFEVDELDYDAIMRAIAKRQVVFRINGNPLIPDGADDLLGRIIAEICRGWLELVEYEQNKGRQQ